MHGKAALPISPGARCSPAILGCGGSMFRGSACQLTLFELSSSKINEKVYIPPKNDRYSPNILCPIFLGASCWFMGVRVLYIT